jgi:hypothetical protein
MGMVLFFCASKCTNESLAMFTSEEFLEVSRNLLDHENEEIILGFVKAWKSVFRKCEQLGNIAWILERFWSYFSFDFLWDYHCGVEMKSRVG